MKIMLDSVNVEEITKWAPLLDIQHITTNPLLLKQNGITTQTKFEEFVRQVGDIIPGVNIFFQCFSEEDVGGISKLKEVFGNINFVAKITMLPKYYPLIKLAQDGYIETAATTCYDIIQIHQACEFSMDYSMVYFAKNDNRLLLNEAVNMVDKNEYEIDLVAASFRTKQDLVDAIKSGIRYATVPPSVLELAYINLSADSDVKYIFGE